MRLAAWAAAVGLLASGDAALGIGALAAVVLWELVGWAAGGAEGFWG